MFNVISGLFIDIEYPLRFKSLSNLTKHDRGSTVIVSILWVRVSLQYDKEYHNLWFQHRTDVFRETWGWLQWYCVCECDTGEQGYRTGLHEHYTCSCTHCTCSLVLNLLPGIVSGTKNLVKGTTRPPHVQDHKTGVSVSSWHKITHYFVNLNW